MASPKTRKLRKLALAEKVRMLNEPDAPEPVVEEAAAPEPVVEEAAVPAPEPEPEIPVATEEPKPAVKTRAASNKRRPRKTIVKKEEE